MFIMWGGITGGTQRIFTHLSLGATSNVSIKTGGHVSQINPT